MNNNHLPFNFERARQLRALTAKQLEAINSNADLTDNAKERDGNAVRNNAREQMRTISQQYFDKRAEYIVDRYRQLFTPRDSDAASRMDYRSAIQFARAANSEAELAIVLRTAIRTGDTSLQQAVAFVAFESGTLALAREALHPNDREDFDELARLENPSPAEQLAERAEFSI